MKLNGRILILTAALSLAAMPAAGAFAQGYGGGTALPGERAATNMASEYYQYGPLTPVTIRRVQEELNALGYNAGYATGRWNAATHRALIRFQKAHYLQPNGMLNVGTVRLLRARAREDWGSHGGEYGGGRGNTGRRYGAANAGAGHDEYGRGARANALNGGVRGAFPGAYGADVPGRGGAANGLMARGAMPAQPSQRATMGGNYGRMNGGNGAEGAGVARPPLPSQRITMNGTGANGGAAGAGANNGGSGRAAGNTGTSAGTAAFGAFSSDSFAAPGMAGD